MSVAVVGAPGSGWRSVRAAASLMLWQAAPWVLVVLVLTSLLFNGSAAWGAWRGAPSGSVLIIQGDQGTATIVSVFVGLAALFSWMRTVRAVVPVLVAGGVTRRAATGGLLISVAALAAATTALLTLVAVAGAALQRGVAAVAPGRSDVVTDDSAYASAVTFTADAPEVYLNPVQVFPGFVVAALGGALLSAAWYRWRGLGVIGVLVAAGVVWSAYLGVAATVPADASRLFVVTGSPRGPFIYLGACLVLALAAWLVLRRVPLRSPAR